MRRFLVRLGAFLVIQVLIGTAAVAFYARSLPNPDDFIAAYTDKEAMLASADSPKMVFIGGSNLPLGLDSEVIAAALPWQPVNMGLLSGVGYEMMRDQVEPTLERGDVLVVALEYERWVDPYHALTVLRVLDHDPSAWRTVPSSYLPGMLDGALAYLGEVTRAARLKLAGLPVPHNTAPYLRSGFNEYGDLTLHRDGGGDGRLGRADIAVLDRLSEDHVRAVVADMNAFSDRMEARGVEVFVTFPAMTPEVYAEWEDEIGTIHRILREDLAIPLLGDPEDFLYPREDFTDHIYHLRDSGIAKRMDVLVPRLVAELPATPQVAAGDAGQAEHPSGVRAPR